MEKNKKLRGSAMLSDEGTFVFTPFAITPDKEKKMKQVLSSHYSNVWLAKNKVSVRMVFDKKMLPPFQVWVEEISLVYNSLKQAIKNEL